MQWLKTAFPNPWLRLGALATGVAGLLLLAVMIAVLAVALSS